MLLADGTVKAIEEVNAGERVRSADPETGKACDRTVVQTLVPEADKLLLVETADGAGIRTTEGHPFFGESRGFVEARRLPGRAAQALKIRSRSWWIFPVIAWKLGAASAPKSSHPSRSDQPRRPRGSRRARKAFPLPDRVSRQEPPRPMENGREWRAPERG